MPAPCTETLSISFEKKFSQLPVYQSGTFVSLLTTDTVARWLADQLTDIELVEEMAVAPICPRRSEPSPRGSPTVWAILTSSGGSWSIGWARRSPGEHVRS